MGRVGAVRTGSLPYAIALPASGSAIYVWFSSTQSRSVQTKRPPEGGPVCVRRVTDVVLLGVVGLGLAGLGRLLLGHLGHLAARARSLAHGISALVRRRGAARRGTLRK